MKRKISFYWLWSFHSDEMFVFTVLPTIQIITFGGANITFDWLCFSIGISISDKDIKP